MCSVEIKKLKIKKKIPKYLLHSCKCILYNNLKSYVSRAFPIAAAPELWNNLPVIIRFYDSPNVIHVSIVAKNPCPYHGFQNMNQGSMLEPSSVCSLDLKDFHCCNTTALSLLHIQQIFWPADIKVIKDI